MGERRGFNQKTINKCHCDWIIKQTAEIAAAFAHNSDALLRANKVRILSSINTAINSLSELKLHIENL